MFNNHIVVPNSRLMLIGSERAGGLAALAGSIFCIYTGLKCRQVSRQFTINIKAEFHTFFIKFEILFVRIIMTVMTSVSLAKSRHYCCQKCAIEFVFEVVIQR